MPTLRVIENTAESCGDIGNRLAAILADDAEDGAIRAIDAILSAAVERRASDVHLEPWDDCVSIRFRIDGVLHDVAEAPQRHQARLATRVKVLARLVVYQKDTPQEGRIDPAATTCGKTIRVSIVPTVRGEKIVMRVLDPNASLLPLDKLGFADEIADGLRFQIRQPQGTFLLTGPSSSGKTTTIYAMLQEMLDARQPRPNIATIEDPVEYRLSRVAQTEVHPHVGLTFESALRSILRQDPEVIVVGEIRDPETARAAVQAGLTGHLVISTIHSGAAAGVFTRLLDMQIEPYLLVSSVTGVLAQRLVRVVCPACRMPYVPSAEERAAWNIEADTSSFSIGRGCEQCLGIGFLGRTAIGEYLKTTDCLAEVVLARSQTKNLHDTAVRAGMKTLRDSAIEKVRAGVTTFSEIGRVLPARGDL